MSEQKRISPEEVVAAYEAKGLTPIQGETLDLLDKCACGIGALYAREQREIAWPMIWAESIYSADYAEGFACGFDNYAPMELGDRYQQGHADGRAAWDAVRGMVENLPEERA